MSILLWGIAFFAITFLIHLFIWRFRRPKNPVRALIFLFSCVISFGLIILYYLWAEDLFGVLYIAIFSCSVFISYLLTYSAIEADSPSLVVVLRIYNAGRSGMSFKDIESHLGDDLLVLPRVKDLVDAGLVDFDGNRYKINKKGTMFLYPFILYRNFLRLGKGG